MKRKAKKKVASKNRAAPKPRAAAKALTKEDADKFLIEERQKKATACHNEVMQVLQRHKCQLVGVPRISDEGTIEAQVALVPIEN